MDVTRKRWIWAGMCVLMAVQMLPGQVEARGRRRNRKNFKIATLAPDGSTWVRLLKQGGTDWRRKLTEQGHSPKRRFQIFAGGVAGDEADVVRKMRIGQLHGAALTSVGLAAIADELLVLQAPGLFRNWDELDYVRDQLRERFETILAGKGFISLAWGDVGFNRIFSSVEVRRPGDLARTKPWCWTQDGIYREFYKVAKAQPVMLGVPEVMPSLQTGLIDTFGTAPLAALSLQWYTKTGYMLDVPTGVTIGAAVISKQGYDALSEAEQSALRSVGDDLARALKSVVRKDNVEAISAMRDSGLNVVTLTQSDKAIQDQWTRLFENSRTAAAQSGVYPASLLADVERVLSDYRQSNGG